MPVERQTLNYAFIAIGVGFCYIFIKGTVWQTATICVSASVFIIWRFFEMGIHTSVQFSQVVTHFVLANSSGLFISILLARTDRIAILRN